MTRIRRSALVPRSAMRMYVGSALAVGFRSLADRMVDDFVRAALAE